MHEHQWESRRAFNQEVFHRYTSTWGEPVLNRFLKKGESISRRADSAFRKRGCHHGAEGQKEKKAQEWLRCCCCYLADVNREVWSPTKAYQSWVTAQEDLHNLLTDWAEVYHRGCRGAETHSPVRATGTETEMSIRLFQSWRQGLSTRTKQHFTAFFNPFSRLTISRLTLFLLSIKGNNFKCLSQQSPFFKCLAVSRFWFSG